MRNFFILVFIIFNFICCKSNNEKIDFNFIVGNWKSINYDVFEEWIKINDTTFKGTTFIDTGKSPIIIDNMSLIIKTDGIEYKLHIDNLNKKELIYKYNSSKNIFIGVNENQYPYQIMYQPDLDNKNYMIVKAGKSIENNNSFLFKYIKVIK